MMQIGKRKSTFPIESNQDENKSLVKQAIYENLTNANSCEMKLQEESSIDNGPELVYEKSKYPNIDVSLAVEKNLRQQ